MQALVRISCLQTLGIDLTVWVFSLCVYAPVLWLSRRDAFYIVYITECLCESLGEINYGGYTDLQDIELCT